MKIQEKKFKKVEEELEKAGVSGLTVNECSQKTGFERITVSRYFRILLEKREVIRIDKPPSKIYLNPSSALNHLKKIIENKNDKPH